MTMVSAISTQTRLRLSAESHPPCPTSLKPTECTKTLLWTDPGPGSGSRQVKSCGRSLLTIIFLICLLLTVQTSSDADCEPRLLGCGHYVTQCFLHCIENLLLLPIYWASGLPDCTLYYSVMCDGDIRVRKATLFPSFSRHYKIHPGFSS